MERRLKLFKEMAIPEEWKDSQKIPPIFDGTPLQPTKVFDDFYCIGTRSVVAWALKTSDGIILIDSMWDNDDAQLIEKGMQELDLNPNEIKYIIVTHGHGDHYGGAQYLKDKYNCKVLMTEVDMDYMNSLEKNDINFPTSPKPKVDILVKNEDILELGDKRVTIIETPGHTPGCISLIFPITNNGKEHTLILWGGTGIPKDDYELQLKYKDSVEIFEEYAKKAKAEIQVVAHLHRYNGYKKLEQVKELKAGEKNPFIIGTEGIREYFNELKVEVDKILNNRG